MKRILILSVGVGGGHNRAAEAIDSWAKKEFAGKVETQWVDVLNHTKKTFRIAYADSYNFLVNYSPKLWGIIYDIMRVKGISKANKITRYFDARAYPQLIRVVTDFKPDVCVCTHFMPANVVLAKIPDMPVHVVVTDYDCHTMWVNENASGYFVANEQVKFLVERAGYDASKITVTGIPISPDFSHEFDRAALRRKFGIPENRMAILVMGGGFGSRYLTEAVRETLSLREDFTLVTVCGKNKKMEDRISGKFGSDARLKVVGFTTEIQNYMNACDFIVSKAGGLTVTEAIASSLPLIVYCPTPGQEEENSTFLLESGVALHASTPLHLRYKVEHLLNHPDKVVNMRSMCKRLVNPFAGRDIVGKLA